MQFLLDEFSQGKLTFDELKNDYETMDTQNNDLTHIKAILQAARDS
jgi:predicted metal-dependent HD superfamily phosphohydrolase